MTDKYPDYNDATIETAVRVLLSHTGADSPVTSRELSEELGGMDTLDSTPNTRELIRYLVAVEGYPIAAGSTGYYMLSDEDELLEYLSSLQNRIQGIQQRQQNVIDAVRERGYYG